MTRSDAITNEQRSLHLLNRLAFGPAPGDLATLRRIGPDRWIKQQLESGAEPEPALTRQLSELTTLRQTPVQLLIEYGPSPGPAAKGDPAAIKAARQRARIIVLEAIRARLYRAVAQRNQLQEVMTAFWFNHFNVFADKGLDYLWVGAYEEEAIRPHALGRFRDLLGATATHPAMLFYLDNWQNTAPGSPGSHDRFTGINENYARELLELHTLGVNGGYSQRDVIALAHILTGWGLARRNTLALRGQADKWFGAGAINPRNGFFFDSARHDFAAQSLLGETIPGRGIEAGEQALDLLAGHPATAHHLSYKLAQYFVADHPPPALVERIAARYRSSGGAIRDVLATLFASPEFWDRRYYAAKFKTPYEFVVSAVRATGIELRNPRPLAGVMARLGMPLYGCQTPDGYKNTREAWLNPEAMMVRLSFATALGTGRLPLDRHVADFDADRAGANGGPPQPLAPPNRVPITPPDPVALAMTLGDNFSSRTVAAVEAAPIPLRAPLILGSPEFMMR